MNLAATLLAFVVGAELAMPGPAQQTAGSASGPAFGQGAYRPGPGVKSPVLLKSTNPLYPPTALSAKVRGDVEVEVVVGADGRVSDARVARSADATFGLDQAALTAARQWTFKPGSRNGQPAPVIQRILETFTILPAVPAGDTSAQLIPVDDEFTTDARRPGLGVTLPVLLAKVGPSYTQSAMRQKIVGVVTLEAIVEKDGTVGPVRVIRSLDAKFGLDDAAVTAAKQWTFRPGTLNGQPVRVIVRLILEFKLH